MATVGESKTPRALAMATYLRAVVGRASERLAAPAAVAQSDNQQESEQPQEEEVEVEDKQKASEESELEGATAAGECDTVSSSGTMDELAESPVPRDEGQQFSIHVEPTRDEHILDRRRRDTSLQWSFCDVLLQPDEEGLGLHLAVRIAPRALRVAGDKRRDVVVVSSFRRVHAEDIGPAEASGKIRTGDVLWTIDGEPVQTLEGVAARISRRSHDPRRFYLLRLVRPVAAGSTEGTGRVVEPAAIPAPSKIDTIASLPPDAAVLIRELVVRNQTLEEQLVASRLKQDEQRIQLDQLHALYAKTQLENWSAFSLPKPFSRRGTFSTESRSGVAGAARAASLTAAAAARLMGANGMQYDVEFAVNAERERLTRQFEQQLEEQKNEMQASYGAKLTALRAANDKKIRMLEFAVKELLNAPTHGENQAEAEGTAPREYSPHVLALRHQLFHRVNGSRASPTTHADCVLCLLEREYDAVSKPHENQGEEWRAEITSILDEYSILKTTRQRQLEDTSVQVAEKVTQDHGDDTEVVHASENTEGAQENT